MPHDEMEARVARQNILDAHRFGHITIAERDALLGELALSHSEEPEETDTLSAETVLEVMRRLLGVNKAEDWDRLDEETNSISIPVVKRDGEKGQVFGFAMFAEDPDNPGYYHVDKQGDMISPDELEDAVYDFVLESRDGGVMHVTKGDATLIESVVFTPEKLEAMGLEKSALPNGAWWLGYQVHNEEARQLVRDGKLAAFSIEGVARREEVAE